MPEAVGEFPLAAHVQKMRIRKWKIPADRDRRCTATHRGLAAFQIG